MKKLLLSCAALAGLLIANHYLDQTAKVLSATEVFAVDGDTIGHGDDRYRLVGFDTPETFRAKCAAEKALGLKAKNRLTEIIQTEGQFELEIEPKLDRYDRYLAVARADGREVGAILISEGLARPCSGGKRLSWCI